MANYFGISSDSVSTLFSGLGSGSSKSILAEYASIRNGSYYKIAKKYYATEDSDKKTSEKDNKNNVSDKKAKLESEKLNAIKSSADKLADVTDEVLKTKKNKEYDSKEMYSKVANFVEEYNKTIDSVKDSESKSINSSLKSMKNATKANQKMLSQIGISVSEEGKLSINKEDFEKADKTRVQSLFTGNGSYAYGIKANASYMSISATNAANQKNIYTNTGKYNNFNQISAFDDLF